MRLVIERVRTGETTKAPPSTFFRTARDRRDGRP